MSDESCATEPGDSSLARNDKRAWSGGTVSGLGGNAIRNTWCVGSAGPTPRSLYRVSPEGNMELFRRIVSQ